MRPCKVKVHTVDGHWVVAIDGEDRLVLDPSPHYDPLSDVQHHLEHLLGDIFI
jgi:hypothetical protein